jgi:branched-chain amino acid transport system substrate-binding protein
MEVAMMRKKSLICLTAFLIVLLGASGLVWAAAEEIRVGSINDMTGGTSDVGKDYALGIAEAIAYVNDTGGINGKKIKLFQYDYGYRIPEAVTTYKRFRDFDKVVAVLGWGTGDTEALSPTVTKDKMPYVSASYSAHLTDPKKTPYNLFFCSDYSTGARSAITAWYDNVWKKDAKYKARRDKGEKPRLVCFYMVSSPYASAPIKAIKDQAALLGFEVGPDQDIPLTALDTKSQVLGAKQFKPDLVWHGNTTMSVATAMRDAYSLGLGAEHIINVWGFDENLPRLAGPAAEGAMGATICAFFGGKAPMMDKIMAYAKKINPGVPAGKRLVRTIQGWGAVLLLTDAMKIADKQGKLNGEGIMRAMETFKNKDFGLGSLPATFSATDHRPTTGAPIYKIEKGKFVLVELVDLKKRWPDKWEKEWLGW